MRLCELCAEAESDSDPTRRPHSVSDTLPRMSGPFARAYRCFVSVFEIE